ARDLTFVLEGLADRLGAECLPNPRGPVTATRQDIFPVRAPGHACDVAVVFQWFAHRLAGFRLPDPGAAVACRHEVLPVRTPGHAVDRAIVLQGLPDRFAARSLPNAGSVVHTTRQDVLSVRAPRHTQDRVLVLEGRTDRLARCSFTHSEALLLAAFKPIPAVGTPADAVAKEKSLVLHRLAGWLAAGHLPHCRAAVAARRQYMLAIRTPGN